MCERIDKMALNPELHSELVDLFTDSFRPPFMGTVAEWCKTNVDLPMGFFSETGHFDVSISPYMVAPMRDLLDLDVTQINLSSAVQTGKSLIFQLYLCYVVNQRPGPTMILSQTDEMAKEMVSKHSLSKQKVIYRMSSQTTDKQAPMY